MRVSRWGDVFVAVYAVATFAARVDSDVPNVSITVVFSTMVFSGLEDTLVDLVDDGDCRPAVVDRSLGGKRYSNR